MSKNKKCDFSGWATKANLLCSDGRIIMKDAFKHNDGQTVPLVWNHQHDDSFNVLGHALLENRDEGVYAYCVLNDTEQGRNAKLLVEHGDITSLSIYANHLKQCGKNVEHGEIREVSLVLAGANPEAFIDSISHSDDGCVTEAVIYAGEDIFLEHADKEKTVQDVYDSMSDAQRKAVESVIAFIDSGAADSATEDNPIDFEKAVEGGKEIKAALESLDEDQKAVAFGFIGEAYEKRKDAVEHSDSEENLEDSFDTFTEDQKNAVYAIVSMIHNGSLDGVDINSGEMAHADNVDGNVAKEIADIFETMSDDQKNTAYAIIGKAYEDYNDTAEHSDKNNNIYKGDSEEMKNNVFDKATETKNEVLSHSDFTKIMSDARKVGSLAVAFNDAVSENAELAHAVQDAEGNTVTYGVANIDYLFPDARAINPVPEFISRNMEWVTKFLNGAKHLPFSRIKSLHADITMDEARARGYIKGTEKANEVFSLLKRTTSPTTVYKHQKLDRDDVVDIVDMDVVAWLKGEMRLMLNEEIARAALVSDGRVAGTDGKINEENIRPIWTDSDTYTVKVAVTLNEGDDDEDIAKNFIKACKKSRKDYKGSGEPTLFTTEDLITDCLLIEDGIGHPLYNDVEALKKALRVKDIVAVPVMENLSREGSGADTGYNFTLMGIIVNPADYSFGADKGGAVSMFDDFDIDFNQMKYLIETRCSGALTKYHSAIAVELKVEADSD